MWDLFGALLMIPFGTLILAGATLAPYQQLRAMAPMSTSQIGTVLGLCATALIGLAFAAILLVNGVGMALDGIGWRRRIEGTLSDKRELKGFRGGSTLYFTVAGESLVASRKLWNLVRDGERVAVEIGRSQRVVYKLWRA